MSVKLPSQAREPTATSAWEELRAHFEDMRGVHMRDLFAAEPERFPTLSVDAEGVLLDFSKNIITQETVRLLLKLARQMQLGEWRAALFAGEAVNVTEGRAALHTVLRERSGGRRPLAGEDLLPAVRGELDKMAALVERLHAGEYRGYSGAAITDVVNIGIGGSDLGPVMVTEALADFHQGGIRTHFVSSIDGVHLGDVLARVQPESTLFIVCSKSFTTLETLSNARLAREWFRASCPAPEQLARHFLAVSSNASAMREFGIRPESSFAMWDWVGGRFSLWSAVGLPIAIALGMEHFHALLEGGYRMDEHFRSAPLEHNLPALLGLLGVWYTDFFGAQTHVLLPYTQRLHRFPAFIQQLEMESNGKSVRRDGEPVQVDTCPVIWGEPGPNAQHSFYQLLHQGTRLAPIDFLLPLQGSGAFPAQQSLAVANCLAQGQALMAGQTEAQVRTELTAAGLPEPEISRLLPHKVHAGNRPSNLLLVERIDPATVGKLVALYEHKVFVQSVLWSINAFDQWGVQLGKRLAEELIPALRDGAPPASADGSLRALLRRIAASGRPAG